MEEILEQPSAIEPDRSERQSCGRSPVFSDGVEVDSRLGADHLAVKRLTPRLNRQRVEAIRLLKGSLVAMLRTGRTLAEARDLLGNGFAHWVQTELPLSTAEADFFTHLFVAKLGTSEKELLPDRELNLARLFDVLGDVVAMWHSAALAAKPPATAQ